MAIEVRELLAGVPLTDGDGGPSLELVEIIQRLVDAVRDHEARIEALEP